MIKVNVILNNIIWKKYLKNPHSFIDKKIELLNRKNKLYKNNTLICSLLLSGSEEIKIIEFDHTDVVRHPLVSKIIRAYQKKSIDDKD